MITVSKVWNMEQTEVMGVAIEVDDQEYFAKVNQDSLPGVRVGSFPRWYNKSTLAMEQFPHEVVLQLETTSEPANTLVE